MDFVSLFTSYPPEGPLFFLTGAWDFTNWQEHAANLVPYLDALLP